MTGQEARSYAEPPPRPPVDVRGLVRRFLPITTWLPGYERTALRPDLLAAVTSWGVMVPVALAYAGLAGVPPELGLVTAFAALAAYAVFGSSRHLKVTVSSTMAIMSASLVADVARGDAALYVALTATLALVVGAMLVAAGLARLGFISDFLAKSVVTGFIFGLAITIIIGQVPKILGVPGLSGTLPEQLAQLVASIPDTNPYTLAVGGISLALILVLRRISRKIPGPLIALALGIVAVKALDLEAFGVTVVGEVATGIPRPSVPDVPVSALPALALGAVGIVFLAVGESVGAGRAYAAKHRYTIDADQEMVALGAANFATGVFGGFTTDASLSQTATAESAGARTQLASLVTSALILATAIVLAPLFADLPNAVLGAIVIAAVLGLMDVAELRRYWAWRRTDFLISMTAMVGVLLTTVLAGMVLAVVLSVAFVLYRASRPYIAALGRMPGVKSTYGDLSRHPDATPVEGLLIVRIDAPLYFFNANVAQAQIREIAIRPTAGPRAVLLDLGATADLDVTTGDMLAALVDDLQEHGVAVMLAQVKGRVRDRMRRTGLMQRIGEDNVHLSIPAGVAAFQALVAASGVAPGAASPTPGTPSGAPTPEGPASQRIGPPAAEPPAHPGSTRPT